MLNLLFLPTLFVPKIGRHYGQKSVSLYWVGAFIVVLTSCESSTENIVPPRMPESVTETVVANQVFEVGDRLELLVEEDESFSGQFEVREGGYILLPKVGRIPVVGLSRDAAENRLREYLQKGQLRQATVFVERRSKRSIDPVRGAGGVQRMMVYVSGGAARPGQHFVPLPPDGRFPGVHEVLLITGGLSNFADESKVRIMRMNASGVRQPILVNTKKISQGKAPDVPVGEGDIIHVAEKVFGF